MSVVHKDVLNAYSLIAPHVVRTPILTSRTLNDLAGAEIFLKMESFQRSGSFKFRGATHAMLNLSPDQKSKGVLTYSSGNHAQALALAGRNSGVSVTVVMPNDAPAVKKAATEGYGAEVILYDRAEETREALGQKLCRERGLTLIPPYDHPHIVAGAGTAALELMQEVPDLDLFFVCLGGGGLSSGSCLAIHGINPNVRILPVEPEAGDDGQRSFRTGTIQTVRDPITIADGARTPSLSPLTFGIIREHAEDILTVSDPELAKWMWFVMERMKCVVEPTGVLGLAGAMSGHVDIRGRRVGVLVSGGNVDLGEVTKFWVVRPTD
ncbi:MAG: pyridoxal-phosphate dependent enzyme [Fimbriimonadaceae bacterium]|jgi:threonine dehydratase|nr:pyridoxal-phosphate dependent enzyme [Fimbriimonadaceae bacterium]